MTNPWYQLLFDGGFLTTIVVVLHTSRSGPRLWKRGRR